MHDKDLRLRGATVNRRPRTSQVRFNSENGMWSASRKVGIHWLWLGEFPTSSAAHAATHCALRLARCMAAERELLFGTGVSAGRDLRR